MKRKLSFFGAVGVGICFAIGACSASEIPAGQDNGLANGDAATDGGSCCPAGWTMYSCNQAGGGTGLACHNPAVGCASSTTCGQGCDEVVTGACGGGSDAGGGSLKWYATCGYPVCNAGDGGAEDGGVCPTPGTACTTKGQTCGTQTAENCGVTYVCDDHDPTAGGCPISSIQYKDNVRYLGAVEQSELHDEAMRIRLATYNYKSSVADPGTSHLGFIIEDDPTSPAVDAPDHRVDMYGYFSMMLATMQVQEKEIADLRSQLAQTRADARDCKSSGN